MLERGNRKEFSLSEISQTLPTVPVLLTGSVFSEFLRNIFKINFFIYGGAGAGSLNRLWPKRTGSGSGSSFATLHLGKFRSKYNSI